jgi:hypothetical protein
MTDPSIVTCQCGAESSVADVEEFGVSGMDHAEGCATLASIDLDDSIARAIRDLEAISKHRASLEERMTSLRAKIAGRIPDNAVSSMGIPSDNFPDARLPMTAKAIRDYIQFDCGTDEWCIADMIDVLSQATIGES